MLTVLIPAVGTERYDNTQKNLAAVTGQTDAAGRPLEVVIVEKAHEADRRNDIFANFCINFYIANSAIIMPEFGIDRDEDAHANIARLFPKHEIVQIEISDIAAGGGGIHCITQQQPAV